MRPRCLQDVYFVMYDLKDNLVCFFDNTDELSRVTKVPRYQINDYFKKKGDYIYIKVYGRLYKLYKYNKEKYDFM